jgi:hypothetical protein
LARGGGGPVDDHGWSLRDAIYRDRQCRVLLDGHNILFGMEDVFRAHYDENGRPGRRAVERLVALTRRLTEGRSRLRMHVFFDAPEHQLLTVSPNLTVEFSGGHGKNRADQRIAEQLEFHRPEAMEEKWFVVSDDRAVRSP